MIASAAYSASPIIHEHPTYPTNVEQPPEKRFKKLLMTNTKSPSEIDAANKQPTRTSINWLSIIALVISSGTATLVLLGYGVSLAAESIFGIPHAALFDSTFELIDLASIAIMEILPTTLESIQQWAFYVRIYREFGIVVLFFAIAWIAVAIVGFFWEPKNTSKGKSSKPKNNKQLHWGKSASQYWGEHFFIIFSIFTSPLASLLAMVFIISAMTALAVIPIIGMNAGTTYINKWVITPEHCVQIQSLSNRRQIVNFDSKIEPGNSKERVAQCVEIKKEGGVIAAGRVIFYTSKAVLLLEDGGRVQRVPTSDSIISIASSSVTPKLPGSSVKHENELGSK